MISSGIIVIGFFISIMGVLLFLTQKSKKKRIEVLKDKAMQLGFSFSKDIASDFIYGTKQFKLFKEGHSSKVHNVIEGRKSDVNFKIFDYIYGSGAGQSSASYAQTIFFVKIENINIPRFIMSPESIFNKIGDKLTKNDIDFERYLTFSKKYHLKGDEEDAIRSVFSDEILQFFEHRKKIISLEADGDTIIIYRRSKLVEPKDLVEFVDESLKMVQMFIKR